MADNMQRILKKITQILGFLLVIVLWKFAKYGDIALSPPKRIKNKKIRRFYLMISKN